jgi:hypothetical protein
MVASDGKWYALPKMSDICQLLSSVIWLVNCVNPVCIATLCLS